MVKKSHALTIFIKNVIKKIFEGGKFPPPPGPGGGWQTVGVSFNFVWVLGVFNFF